jgi:hypothetical protein
MRTKTLLLTAAVGMVGIATSLAQVYSVNAVGYVNLTLRSNPGGPTLGTIIANPLIGTNNSLNTILTLPDTHDGTVIYRFDPATQNYKDPISYIAGFGWLAVDEADLVINPGEAFWIYPQGPDPLSITFVGDVPQGALSNPLPPANKLSMRSSQVPQQAPLGSTGDTTTLQFAGDDGDVVYIFDPAIQNYKDPYSFIDGFGWLGPDGDEKGPIIGVGTGFFVQKSPTAVKTSWDRTFNVN